MLLTMLAHSLVVFGLVSPPPAEWENLVRRVPYAARENSVWVAFQDRLWTFGGDTEFPDYGKDLVWSSADGLDWQQETVPNEPFYRKGLRVTVFGNALWLTGGEDLKANSNKYYNDIWMSKDGRHWEQVLEDAPWEARGFHQTLVFGDRLWLIGGTSTEVVDIPEKIWRDVSVIKPLDDIWSSEDGIHWQLENDEPPWYARYSHQCVAHEGRIWLLGGQSNWAQFYSDVWSSGNGKDWVEETAEAPWGKRTLHQVIEHQGSLWLLGGKVHDGRNSHLDASVWSSVDGRTWQSSKTELPLAISGHAVASFHNELWVGCGKATGDEDGYRDYEKYFDDIWHSPSGTAWEGVNGAGRIPPQYGQTLVVHEGSLYALGGRIESPGVTSYSTVWSTEDGIDWTNKSMMPGWAPRHMFGAASFQGKLWVVGGIWMKAKFGPTGERLSPSADSEVWSSIDGIDWQRSPEAFPVPWPARMYPLVTVFDDKLWVIGGKGDGRELTDAWFTRDGITWELAGNNAPTAFSDYRRCVVHEGRMWIVGPATNDGAIWSSQDGVLWENMLHDPPWGDITPLKATSFGGYIWYVASNGAWVSSDGKSWLSYEIKASPGWTGAVSDLFLGTLWGVGGSTDKMIGDITRLKAEPVLEDARERLSKAPAVLPATEFEPIDWVSAPLTDVEQAKYEEQQLESQYGWVPLMPRYPDSQVFKFAPVVWNGNLWAFSATRLTGYTPDGEHWFGQKPEWDSYDDDYAPAMHLQSAVHRGKLWVLRQGIAPREIRNQDREQSKSLFSSADGRNWVDESGRLPKWYGEISMIEARGSLYFIGLSDVAALQEEGPAELVNASPEWEWREGSALAEHDGALYMVGGSDSIKLCSDVWRSPDGEHWTRICESAPFTPRTGAGLTYYRGHFWLIGGTSNGALLSDVWVSEDATDWRCLAERNDLLVSGGPSLEVFRDHLWHMVRASVLNQGSSRSLITSDGLDWTPPPGSLPWSPRANTSLVAFQGQWWMLGGTTPDLDTRALLPEVWSTRNWTDWTLVAEDAEPFRLNVENVVATDSNLWAIGRRGVRDYSVSPEVWRSADGKDWTLVAEHAAWEHLENYGVAALNNRLLVFGGYEGLQDGRNMTRSNEVYASDDGINWTVVGTLPKASEDAGFFDFLPFTHRGELWVNLDGNPSDELWHTKDGADWTKLNMEGMPEKYYGKTILSHDGRIWLLSGSFTQGKTDMLYFIDMESWWSSDDGRRWIPVPHGFPLDDSWNRDVHVQSTELGLLKIDTSNRGIAVWDEDTARAAYQFEPKRTLSDRIQGGATICL
ncbi:MAG: hypothetical protein GC168_01030 [Candidatus Hydrogenedens sp.]|nr:hypothetical protein [Candidatus Hydrogenedens sp.]